DTSHWGVQAGFGHASRLYLSRGDNGESQGGISKRVMPMVGRGETTFSRSGSAEEGESKGTWDLSTTYSMMGEFKLGEHGPTMGIGSGFRYGVQYAGQASEFNRVNIEFMPIMFQLGGSDASTRAGNDNDTEMGGAGLGQAWYSMAHGWAVRYALNGTISDPLERIKNSPYHGLVDGNPNSGHSGAMQNIPVIEAGAAAAGALGDSVSPAALNSNTGMFLGFLAARTLGDTVSVAAGGGASQAAGGAGILGSARLLGYLAAGMESPASRRMLTDKEIERRGLWVNSASWALNSAALLIGMAADSDVMMKAGVGANMHISLSPDAIDGTLVDSTEVGAMFDGVSGQKDGSRAAIVAHHHLRGAPLYTSVGVASPALL
ncbi:MAG: hypothetical protein Q8O57_11935, partial [Kiritimatiellota bacterium]|nr:hypothetical protein [Kiritimatiellota bacterium]